MALYLNEKDVADLLTMPEAVEALDAAFRRQSAGQIINQPRRRLFMPDGTFHHAMAAADMELGVFSTKLYASFAPKTRFLVLLYSAQNGDLLAIIEGDLLGQMRTGAATGVATRYLANQQSPINVGIIGTGWQAQSQIEAVCAACTVTSVTAYGRHAERAAVFCERTGARVGLTIAQASEPEQAITGKSVVITATTSKTPVFEGEWLETGTHVNAVGSNLLMKREIDDATISRADLITVDSIEQSKLEAGDLLPAYEKRLFRWEQIAELSDIVSGKHSGRTTPDQITLFKSNGIALEDTAVANLVYRKALANGKGVEIAMWQ